MDIDLDDFRPRMLSVAYRMLRSLPDAEDAVQDAFLRLHAASEVTSPEGFLVTTTRRCCLDRLRRNRRRMPAGQPAETEPVDTRDELRDRSSDAAIRQAFQVMLERLTPSERVAFFLRKVFQYDYAQLAAIVCKSELYVRQIVSRANSHLAQGKSRFHPTAGEADRLAEQFLAACRAGDLQRMEQMFADEVVLCPLLRKGLSEKI